MKFELVSVTGNMKSIPLGKTKDEAGRTLVSLGYSPQEIRAAMPGYTIRETLPAVPLLGEGTRWKVECWLSPEERAANHEECGDEAWVCEKCRGLHVHRTRTGGLTSVDSWCDCAREAFWAKRRG